MELGADFGQFELERSRVLVEVRGRHDAVVADPFVQLRVLNGEHPGIAQVQLQVLKDLKVLRAGVGQLLVDLDRLVVLVDRPRANVAVECVAGLRVGAGTRALVSDA